MLSQLGKTIKLALKSNEEERAILRARSAVQRFPVVEWRQKTEDFHKRSINTSRTVAGDNAFTAADCDGSGARPIGMDSDWTPEQKGELKQPDWDARSTRSSVASHSQEVLSHNNVNGHLGVPSRHKPNNASRSSVMTDASDDEYASDNSRANSQNNPYGQVPPSTPGPSTPGANYGGFLSKANKQIAKDQRHVGDPFLDGNPTPNRPFTHHSRVSSVESISSIVDEHTASPLNKSMAAVSNWTISQ